jgi:tetratricopeptide (TPR) repeat protein
VATLAAGYLAARSAVLGSALASGNVAAGLEGLDAAGRATVMLPATMVWLRWMLWPLRLSADYSPNHFVPEPQFGLAHAVAAVILLGLLALAWASRRRAPGIALGLAWAAATASVAANVAVPTGVLLAERVMYLPSVGAAIALGAAWELLPRKRLTWILSAAFLALLGARSVWRIPVWRDEHSFRRALVEGAPASYRSRWALAAEAFDRGDRGQGERHYLEAARIYPFDATLLHEIGRRYLAAGFHEPADRFLTAALMLDSERVDAMAQAVVARTRAGRPDSAVALGERALARFPTSAPLLLASLDAYLAQDRPARALALARRLIWLDSSRWQHHQLAAFAAARSGRCEEAWQRLERATSLAPPGERAPADLAARIAAGEGCGAPSR